MHSVGIPHSRGCRFPIQTAEKTVFFVLLNNARSSEAKNKRKKQRYGKYRERSSREREKGKKKAKTL